MTMFTIDPNDLVPRAVKLTNKTNSSYVDVIYDGTNYRLAVDCTSSGTSGTATQIFNEVVIAANTPLLVTTYTVPVGKTFILEGVIIGGGDSGKFEVQIDTVIQARIRTSGSARTINTMFPAPYDLIAGQVIDVKARNVGDLQATFEATIYGRVN
jgi:hypothetical protein